MGRLQREEDYKMTGQFTKKSGKGNNHGVVSEVSAYLTVKPGHEEEARAARSPVRRDTEEIRLEGHSEDRSTGRAVGELR